MKSTTPECQSSPRAVLVLTLGAGPSTVLMQKASYAERAPAADFPVQGESPARKISQLRVF